MKKRLIVIVLLAIVGSVIFPSAAFAYDWAVGNTVGLCAGTRIYQGSGRNYPEYPNPVPEDDWQVVIIDGPRYGVDGEVWWDISRAATGDPSGGTGWVVQSEAEDCDGGGSGGGGVGTEVDPIYSNPFGDPMNPNDPPLPDDITLPPVADGFQWPYSDQRDAYKTTFIKSGYHFLKTVETFEGSGIYFLHQGYDYASIIDSEDDPAPIYAIGNGKVIHVMRVVNKYDVNKYEGYGLYIVIMHVAPNGEIIYSLYAHLYPGTALVREGEYVARGTQIARQDTTGNSTGPHLHFEIRKPGGDPINNSTWKNVKFYTMDENVLRNGFYGSTAFISGNWWEDVSISDGPTKVNLAAQTAIDAVSEESTLHTGEINPGEQTGIFKFLLNSITKYLKIAFSFLGSSLEITIYRPDGSVYGVYQVVNPPMIISIPDAEAGEWGYSIRAIDVPYDNYPYAVGIGTRDTPTIGYISILGDNPLGEIDGDISPPTTLVSLSPSAPNGNNDWYVSSVEISMSADDQGVGVATTRYWFNTEHIHNEYINPFTYSQEGVNRFWVYSVDGRGNNEPTKSMEIKIDLTPPVVEVFTDQTEYARTDPFIVHFSGYDPMPGSGLYQLLADFSGLSVVDGQSVDLFWYDLGEYTLTATGEDYAGWVTTESTSIEIVATIESLMGTVEKLCTENYIDNHGVCNSLSSKLENALADRDRGQIVAAIGVLEAFQNQVEAQANKSISEEAVNLLLMDSEYVLSVLNAIDAPPPAGPSNGNRK